MWPSVSAAFVAFNSPLEGVCKNAYLDVKGLLTTAIGVLIDPAPMAYGFEWVTPDGKPASVSLIASELAALKAQQGLKDYPALSQRVLNATTIRLTDHGVLQAVTSRMVGNEPFMRNAFPDWATWPADCQLAAHSMCWALGAGWPATFGNCARFCRLKDFVNAALSCDINATGNPGVIPRNTQNRFAFTNGSVVLAQGLDPSVLYWPKSPLSAVDAPSGVA